MFKLVFYGHIEFKINIIYHKYLDIHQCGIVLSNLNYPSVWPEDSRIFRHNLVIELN